MSTRQKPIRPQPFCMLLVLLVFLFVTPLPGSAEEAAEDLPGVEVRDGRRLYHVHPDEVGLVNHCLEHGIGFNLNYSTSNPAGGEIVKTKRGRVIVLYPPKDRALTLEQLQPLKDAKELSAVTMPVWVDDETLGFFTEPERFPKLAVLMIRGAKVTDDGIAGLKNLPRFQSLSIYKSSTLTDAGVEHLSNIPSIRLLRLHSTGITDQGVAHLAKLPELSHLELNTARITDAGLKPLGKLKKLEKLYLDGTQVTGAGFNHLSELPELSLLSLNKTPVDDQGLARLAEFPNLRKMEVLYLAQTKITDAGCPAFERLNHLKVLALHKTAVTDEGLRHVNNMPALYNLTFSEHVTPEGKRWLAENAEFADSLMRRLGRKQGQRQEKEPEKDFGHELN